MMYIYIVMIMYKKNMWIEDFFHLENLNTKPYLKIHRNMSGRRERDPLFILLSVPSTTQLKEFNLENLSVWVDTDHQHLSEENPLKKNMGGWVF